MVQLNLKVTFSSFEKREHELDGIEGPVFFGFEFSISSTEEGQKDNFSKLDIIPTNIHFFK